MKGNWCKRCEEFVEIKKDYLTYSITFAIIYLIAIVIGLAVWFPWGGLIALAIPIFCTRGEIVRLFFQARRVCIICGKTTRRKKMISSYQQTPPIPRKRAEKPEKNFIVLTEMKGKDGVINYFVPSLKDLIADKINKLLNECEFTGAPNDFKSIIPNYSESMAIYCICEEIAEIDNIHICNWKNQFKFYLFESKECKCGKAIYALSLMK